MRMDGWQRITTAVAMVIGAQTSTGCVSGITQHQGFTAPELTAKGVEVGLPLGCKVKAEARFPKPLEDNKVSVGCPIEFSSHRSFHRVADAAAQMANKDDQNQENHGVQANNSFLVAQDLSNLESVKAIEPLAGTREMSPVTLQVALGGNIHKVPPPVRSRVSRETFVTASLLSSPINR